MAHPNLTFGSASRRVSFSPFTQLRFRLHLAAAAEGQLLLAFLLLYSHEFRSLLVPLSVWAFSGVSPPLFHGSFPLTYYARC
jgi:hypothetical protein